MEPADIANGFCPTRYLHASMFANNTQQGAAEHLRISAQPGQPGNPAPPAPGSQMGMPSNTAALCMVSYCSSRLDADTLVCLQTTPSRQPKQSTFTSPLGQGSPAAQLPPRAASPAFGLASPPAAQPLPSSSPTPAMQGSSRSQQLPMRSSIAGLAPPMQASGMSPAVSINWSILPPSPLLPSASCAALLKKTMDAHFSCDQSLVFHAVCATWFLTCFPVLRLGSTNFLKQLMGHDNL